MAQAPDLTRFVAAQDASGTYDRALAELRDGRKVSHWMWFVFPQIAGLGRSPTAQRYAIASRDEAVAYLADPVLGPRLERAAQALADLDGQPSAADVLGEVDAMKLRSSMTLFARAAAASGPPPGGSVFDRVLDRYFGGEPDPATEARL
jgi:uncharacterized protein (DUF1810 family)